MKKKGIRVALTVMACILLIGLLYHAFPSYERRQKEYYADMGNFITGEATVKNIIYSEEDNKIVLWLYDTDPSYQTPNFVIKGNNTTVALENGILDKVKIGDTITVTSAPRFFYDGYMMPIIGLSIGDTEILNIETGHRNLMDMY